MATKKQLRKAIAQYNRTVRSTMRLIDRQQKVLRKSERRQKKALLKIAKIKRSLR